MNKASAIGRRRYARRALRRQRDRSTHQLSKGIAPKLWHVVCIQVEPAQPPQDCQRMSLRWFAGGNLRQ